MHDKKSLLSFCLWSEQIPRPLQPMQGHRWESVNRVGKGRLGLPGASQHCLKEGFNKPSLILTNELSSLPSCQGVGSLFSLSMIRAENQKKKKKKAGPQLFHLHKHKYVSFSSEKGFPATVCLYVCVCVCRHTP